MASFLTLRLGSAKLSSPSLSRGWKTPLVGTVMGNFQGSRRTIVRVILVEEQSKNECSNPGPCCVDVIVTCRPAVNGSFMLIYLILLISALPYSKVFMSTTLKSKTRA